MLVNKAFTDLLTFSRGSGAGYFNSAGIFVQAANDAPRFDYDPVTLQPRGMLIEEGRSNLITYSAALDNAAWAKSNCTVTAGAALAPDGTMSAGKIVGASGASARYVASAAATTTNTLIAGSIFAKAAGYSKFRLNLTNFASDSRGVFVDLAAGSIYQTDVNGSDFTGISGSVSPIGGGWYRCVVLALKGSANSVVRLGIDPKDNAGASAGDGTSGIYAWGGQVELGGFSTTHIPTVAAQVSRATESAVITDLTKIGYNASEGTLFVDAEFPPSSTVWPRLLELGTPDFQNRILIMRNQGASTVSAEIVAANVSQAFLNSSPVLSSGQGFKAAVAFKQGSAALAVNGVIGSTLTPAALPIASRLGIGGDAGSSSQANGRIRAARYYPRRLSNAELQALTVL